MFEITNKSSHFKLEMDFGMMTSSAVCDHLELSLNCITPGTIFGTRTLVNGTMLE